MVPYRAPAVPPAGGPADGKEEEARRSRQDDGRRRPRADTSSIDLAFARVRVGSYRPSYLLAARGPSAGTGGEKNLIGSIWRDVKSAYPRRSADRRIDATSEFGQRCWPGSASIRPG